MDWGKYDAWKLRSPDEDSLDIEIFKAEKYEYYTTDYDDIVKFDLKMIETEKEQWDVKSYDDQDEYLHETAENLADELNLHEKEWRAEEAHIENLRERYDNHE